MSKKRRIKPPNDLSYGLLELAAQACGFSQLGIMEQMLGPGAAQASARGYAKLTKGKKTKKDVK